MLLPIGIGCIFGLIAGWFVHQQATTRETIYGGTPTQILHYLASATMTSLPVMVLLVAVARGFVVALLTALSVTVISWVVLLAFAVAEKQPRHLALSKQVDRGWTEQDARTSGL
ncbi:MAG: hypothetical protein ACOYLB_05815 [Phototrophicaceae bacterium]